MLLSETAGSSPAGHPGQRVNPAARRTGTPNGTATRHRGRYPLPLQSFAARLLSGNPCQASLDP
jgi:hypothetical protein